MYSTYSTAAAITFGFNDLSYSQALIRLERWAYGKASVCDAMFGSCFFFTLLEALISLSHAFANLTIFAISYISWYGVLSVTSCLDKLSYLLK